MAENESKKSPPGPGEPGFDKLAVPKYILELLRGGTKPAKVPDKVRERYPYSQVNARHVAWMASAQSFSDLDPSSLPEES